MIHETIEKHRNVWSKKIVLQRVYHEYYRKMLRLCSESTPIVELGCGGGFFKEFCPDIIATDLEDTPWSDKQADCCDLPFENDSVGNIVMVDVFHHIANPFTFLHEASRVLKKKGRVVMLEPWASTLGYHFYKHIHHEEADWNVNLNQPFDQDKDAFDGNAVLPTMFFTSKDHTPPPGHLEGLLHVHQVERLPAISWLLTGGFQPYRLLPNWLLPATQLTDRLIKPLAGLIALRAIIVLEKPE